MAREKSISVRFAAVGGQAVKAEMRDIGQSGRSAMQTIVAGADPASDSLEHISRAASQARQQLEAIASRSAFAASKMRTSMGGTSDIQNRINASTGVSPVDGQSAAAMLAQGQALDDLRAKFNPLFAVIRQYREQVSEIRHSHGEGAISASEMAEAIGKVRRESLGAIDKIKGLSAANLAAARATEDAARSAALQAQQLTDLRARYNPLFGVISQYRAEVARIRAAHGEGAISGDEMANAIGKVRREALGAIDKIKGLSAANKDAARAAEEAAQAMAKQAQQASDLRAKYNPAFRVIRQYKDEVASIRAAHASGALSANEMAAAISRVRQASLASLAAVKVQTQATNQMSHATRVGAQRMQQMFFQVNDIGVSLAGGMNPFVVMAQQGTQIAQIYGFGNGGVSGIFKDLGGMITKMPGPLKALAVVLGLGAGAIAGLQHEINKTSRITVSFGDTAKAVFQVLGRNIYSYIKPAIDMIAPWFKWAWEKAVSWVKWGGNFLINGVKASVTIVGAAVEVIPKFFGAAFNKAKELALSAMAGIIDGVGYLIDGVARAIDSVFGTSLAGGNAAWAAGAVLEDMAAEAGVAADHGFANAKSALGKNVDGIGAIMGDDPMGRFFGDVSKQAQANAVARQKDKKKKGGKDGSEKEEKRAIDELIASLQQELLVLRETDPIKKKMLEYSEQMKDATDSERAQVLGLVKALDEAQNGYQAVGRTLMEFMEASKRLGQEWGSSFVNAINGAGDAFANFVTKGKLDFSSMIESWASDIAKLAFQQHIGGPLAGWLGGLLGFGGGDPLTAALQGAGLSATAPSFDGGGHTGYGSRSGGLDGKGGFRAILHPNETVVDHTKRGGGGGSGRVMVGVDPKNGNLTAYVDERIQSQMPAMFEAYGRQVLPHQLRTWAGDKRAIG